MEVSAVNTNQDRDQFLVDTQYQQLRKSQEIKCQDLYIDIYNLIC
jgi:hypothetical protein